MFESFEEFLTQSSVSIPIISFILNLLLTGLFSTIISQIYLKYGKSLSNRRLFSENFLLISMTTMVIITIVKSSLALSLGLVGALSIVRFRAAIKEPEELSYLFLSIAIGLGFGANQGLIVTLALFIITVVIMIRHSYMKVESQENQNLYLSISTLSKTEIELSEIVDILSEHCSKVNLKRFDETDENLEINFIIQLISFNELKIIKTKLRNKDKSMRISFLDQQMIL